MALRDYIFENLRWKLAAVLVAVLVWFSIQLAIQKGFQNYIWLTIHTDLDNLRDQPRFKALLNRVLKR